MSEGVTGYDSALLARSTPHGMNVGCNIGFSPHISDAGPISALREIQIGDVALDAESASLLPAFMVREPIADYAVRPRIYVDTSVIGGCEDDQFRKASRRLFDAFRRGKATLVFSEVTRMELENAPPAVRAIIERVPQTHYVTLPVSERARKLADAYIASGAVGPSHYNDALHVAIASVGGVDVIASWNLKHMVRLWRIQAYNDVNRRLGYPMIDIQTPGDIYRDQ